LSKIAIASDSQSCLPPELIKQYGITIVPMTVVIDGKPYLDQVDISVDEFWRIFNEKGHEMSTAPASPGIFKEAFDELAKTYVEIVCTTVSKKLSVTYQSALDAAKMVMEEKPEVKIEVVDTNSASGAQGLMTIAMARAAEDGKSMAEVVAVAEEMKPRVKMVMGLQTLKQLIKIGRAPKIRGYLGELLGVKPITGLVNNTGLVEPVGKARGMKKMTAMLVDLVGKYADASKPMHVIVHYSDSIDDGENLKKIVEDRYNCAEIYMSAYTPVMGAATGPILAISFYSD